MTLPLGDRDGVRRTAMLADELGFDRLASGEHVMFPTRSTPSALVALAFAAAVSERVRLLTAVVLTPLYPAALLAKMAASLDVLSGGRLDLGVGVGGEFPVEFEACGTPIAERGRRTDEAIDVLRALWSGADAFDGRYTTFSGGRLDTQPMQSPGPPVWVAGRRDAAIRRAARAGHAWFPYLYTPEQVAASIERLAVFAAEFDRTTPPTQAFCFVNVQDDGEAARREAAAAVSATYGQDFTGSSARYLVAGTPGEVRRRLQEYVDAGAVGIVASLAAPPDNVESMMRRYAAEVMPAVTLPR